MNAQEQRARELLCDVCGLTDAALNEDGRVIDVPDAIASITAALAQQVPEGGEWVLFADRLPPVGEWVMAESALTHCVAPLFLLSRDDSDLLSERHSRWHAIASPQQAPQAVVGVLTNPHTGTPRDYRDVESDPAGVLIVEPGAPLHAAHQPQREAAGAVAWQRRYAHKLPNGGMAKWQDMTEAEYVAEVSREYPDRDYEWRTLSVTTGQQAVDDARLDAVIGALDEYAREQSSYDYGLPIYHDDAMPAMREIIRAALTADASKGG